MKHALLLFTLIATQAHAQIIYTDVDPDALYYTGGNDTCSLDLNNDGNIDFLIVQLTWQVPCPGGGEPACAATSTRPRSWVRITPTGTNDVRVAAPYASQLPQGDAIDPALAWSNSSGLALMTQGTPQCLPWQFGGYTCIQGLYSGAWWGTDSYSYPYFLGLRFDSAGSTYYGWARVGVSSMANSFTLMSYAYNSVPDEPILAGDNGMTGITRTALRGMQVSPNPFSSALSIALPTGTTGAVSCSVLSLTGQVLITRYAAATSGPSSITLDLASLAPGTYLLEMQMDGERIVRKVLKE